MNNMKRENTIVINPKTIEEHFYRENSKIESVHREEEEEKQDGKTCTDNTIDEKDDDSEYDGREVTAKIHTELIRQRIESFGLLRTNRALDQHFRDKEIFRTCSFFIFLLLLMGLFGTLILYEKSRK